MFADISPDIQVSEAADLATSALSSRAELNDAVVRHNDKSWASALIGPAQVDTNDIAR